MKITAATTNSAAFRYNVRRWGLRNFSVGAMRDPLPFRPCRPLTGRPDQLRELIEDTDTEVWQLEPGKMVEW